MFDKFKSHYKEYKKVHNQLFDIKEVPFKYTELLLDIGGVSYNKGLYTIHTFDSSLKWARILTNYFSGFKDEILPFAYDWNGRHYCVPRRGYEDIYMFDPTDLKDYKLNDDLINFHNYTVVDGLDMFDENYFSEVLDFLKVDGLKENNCIGYKIPLFLNGNPNSLNCEVINMNDYWLTQYRINENIKHIPEGSTINYQNLLKQIKS